MWLPNTNSFLPFLRDLHLPVTSIFLFCYFQAAIRTLRSNHLRVSEIVGLKSVPEFWASMSQVNK